MSNLQQFQFNSKDIRVIEKEGEPWFVARDVCEVLEIQNISQAVESLDEDEKLTYTMYISGQNRAVRLINESGLYSLVLTSRKPEAKTFKKWITSEVIPQIRKTGSYQRPKSLEELSLEVITGLTARIQEMTPKAEFFDTVADAKGDRTIMDTAKLLKIDKPRKLYEMLRNDGVTMSDNIPYQEYIYQGYFRVNVSVNNGHTNSTTYVTNKGLIWLEKKYKHLQKAV